MKVISLAIIAIVASSLNALEGTRCHSVVVAPGSDGAIAVSSWIVDKGQPMATPVPAKP